jgi:hypothetical protein
VTQIVCRRWIRITSLGLHLGFILLDRSCPCHLFNVPLTIARIFSTAARVHAEKRGLLQAQTPSRARRDRRRRLRVRTEAQPASRRLLSARRIYDLGQFAIFWRNRPEAVSHRRRRAVRHERGHPARRYKSSSASVSARQAGAYRGRVSARHHAQPREPRGRPRDQP